jgi:hypothetical protein
MSVGGEHAKAWAALIMAVLVIIENYFGFSFGPVTSNGVTDILVVVGAGLVWLLPSPRQPVAPPKEYKI